MGTRADFYVGKHEAAEWIGSIGWDGYRDGIDEAVLTARTEEDFRAAVAAFFTGRDDVTLPAQGWPWPWDTSATTDCSYWFFDGSVYDEHQDCYTAASTPIDTEGDRYTALRGAERIRFPDMSSRKSVAFDNRSGAIFIG